MQMGPAVNGEGDLPVMIVEDDRDIRDVVTVLLEREGFATIPVADGETAVKLAHGQPIGLVFLDLVLPDVAGSDVLRRLRADPTTADIPVVAFTALPQLAPKGVTVLKKPCDLDEIVSLVREYRRKPRANV